MLLIVTYRSPILWLVPLTVIAFADRLSTSVGAAVSQVTGPDVRRRHLGNHQCLGLRCGHELRTATDSRATGRKLARTDDHYLALRTAVGRAAPAHSGQQRHRGARASHPRCRRLPGHPQPRRAGRLRTAGDGAVSCCWCCPHCSACSAGGCSGRSFPAPAVTPPSPPVCGTASPHGSPATPAA